MHKKPNINESNTDKCQTYNTTMQSHILKYLVEKKQAKKLTNF